MNNEKDLNLIELLKQALLFYANKDNYNGARDIVGLVEKDRGHQARFALDKVIEFEKNLDELKEEYDIMIKNIRGEDSPENVLKIIEDLKNVGNED